jgi:hypothetical protein
MDFYGNPEIKKAYQAGFNDGYSSAISNVKEEGLITDEQQVDLLTELVDEEGE